VAHRATFFCFDFLEIVLVSKAHPNNFGFWYQSVTREYYDDLEYLRSIPKMLKPWEFKVTTLADPQDFWAVLESVVPDILILEINIPEINGLKLCQSLRNSIEWQRLPVLFLSVITDLNTQNLAFGVGADDYLCKPIIGSDLANRIHNRLQRVRAYSNLR